MRHRCHGERFLLFPLSRLKKFLIETPNIRILCYPFACVYWGCDLKRFILLSFGFLGWVFYEMSGGSDFEPRSVQMARMNPTPEVQTAEIAAPAEPEAVKVAFVDTDPPLKGIENSVTRVSLNLTTLQDVLDDTDSAEPDQQITADVTDDSGVPQNVGVLTSSSDTPAIIPSLIDPNDGVTIALNDAQGDIRVVSGNRVNVRGGPGTDYGVVTKLTEGAEVRVLLDNGDGWVKMQPLDGSPEGWMADFLLTNG